MSRTALPAEHFCEPWAADGDTGSPLIETNSRVRAPQEPWANTPKSYGGFSTASATFVIGSRHHKELQDALLNHKMEQMGLAAYL